MHTSTGWSVAGLVGFLFGQAAFIQQPISPPISIRADADLDRAQTLMGRALFLRGFYAANELTFDASGKVAGTPKTTDWTLAAMDVQKAERKAPGRIELEGVRVAIRFNPDQRVFERHPQKDEKVQIAIADNGDTRAFDAALKVVFSTGIDPALQAAMPDYWQHYFTPSLPWPQDALAGKTVVAAGAALPAGSTRAGADKKVEPKLTAEAERDHVAGAVQVRLIVDEQGHQNRVAILLPLGYGLDERTVEAVKQWRFHPALRDGKPVPAGVVVNQGFEYVASHP